MCGIAGFVGNGTQDDIRRMTEALTHRGPNDSGIWSDPVSGIYLGHRRLSIIDINDGHQPMVTADGRFVIVFNGEIYNCFELREALEAKGHVFVTDHSDTEVLLHGFNAWGETLPNRLNGMWALAILDRWRKTLFLSRDRFGKKPLFYSFQDHTFAFSSELSSVAKHPSITLSPSLLSLKKYFAYGYIPAPNSLYHQVHKLPGGFNLTVDLSNFSITVKKYWDFILEPVDSIPDHPEAVWGDALREQIERAVKRRLISDVPVGVFLSGGIDSSAVTAFASKLRAGQGLDTFSVGFSEASFDESVYARQVADFFNTRHHSELLSVEKARTLLPAILSRLDEPMGDSSLLPTYLLCRETVKHVTVALGGDGADELFAGYDPFKALKLAEFYQKIIPRPIHHAIRWVMGLMHVSHANMSPDFKIKRTLRGLSYPKKFWNSIWLGPLSPAEIEAVFFEPCDMESVYSEAISCWDGCGQDNLVDKTLQFYTKLYLQDDILVKVDRASMMNSLEVRAPFLDIELVDFVRKIPWNYKYRNGQTKYILKKALEPLLPKEILHRPKKGFGAPIGAWFKKGLLEIECDRPIPHIDTNQVGRMIEAHQKNQVDHRAFLWNYWILSFFKMNNG